ncbi:hypothetical protein GQ54DRAFT_307318 [Martensiomyces pterosporus]|nr:hypothetical protein GQ54DRAFT_307318 [Martensiomyces pterosporus]
MTVLSRLIEIPWFGYLSQLHAALSDTGYTKILATSASVLLVCKVVYALYFSPLRSVPGPLLARMTKKRAEVFGGMGRQALKAREEYELYGDVYMISMHFHQERAVQRVRADDFRNTEKWVTDLQWNIIYEEMENLQIHNEVISALAVPAHTTAKGSFLRTIIATLFLYEQDEIPRRDRVYRKAMQTARHFVNHIPEDVKQWQKIDSTNGRSGYTGCRIANPALFPSLTRYWLSEPIT